MEVCKNSLIIYQRTVECDNIFKLSILERENEEVTSDEVKKIGLQLIELISYTQYGYAGVQNGGAE